MFSYWEQDSFVKYQHIIIGAGIVGLSVALELRQRFPKASILVLERGFMSTGASSRNAGFACMGSPTELLADLKTMSETEVTALFAARKKGLELLRTRLGDDRIGYAANGSYELIEECNLSALEQLEYLNTLLQPIVGQPAFALANDKIKTFGFSPNYTQALIENTCEGEIHTGKMLRALCDLALENKIEIKTGASVSHFEEKAQAVQVFVPDALRQEQWNLSAQQLYLCTNAFTPQLFPEEEVIPGRGQVLITKPIAHLPFKGIFHFDDGYYYFRAIDGRVLLGGGRNIDFETERTTELALNKQIQSKLDELLRDLILPNTPFEIEQRWSGIMAFGTTKMPIVKSFSSRIYGVFRMGGMGVALGSEAAKHLMSMLCL
ncbi:MAG: FAD-dependent oxidoreductase [Phycisphaerales bacterium]|nr:FAD-dependent oxidoreductase [Phycisphaerales bacterium]